MRFEHLGASPRIHPDAVVASTAVISGDVEIGAGCQILHGAVITAEGSPIRIGAHVIVMENALIRASAVHPVHIGDHVLVGPMASISGAEIEDEVYLATGSRVVNGARVGRGSLVRTNAVVHLRTTLPEGTVVPLGWVAIGDPVQLLPAAEAEAIGAAREELDFPGYVFGLDRSAPDYMVQLTERYGSALGRHRADRPAD
ncbi:gamma carbonic anhydrase family protein [Microbacterium fluvii]|uniref:Gamma carbonic anhydrase family protein n=1 Tax=Microbacterium fluvii TaxID=415215 RepID=A0ABW2HG86_9MICO|nr:gamma carbonic anhydrase family protein [Microbacterium fluvii]MCU4672359.1 gamma carbonic anhydrase family protein [Microbacterium fluvii]